jgi:hypothetical protein
MIDEKISFNSLASCTSLFRCSSRCPGLHSPPAEGTIPFPSTPFGIFLTSLESPFFPAHRLPRFNLYGSNSPPLAALSMKQHFDDTPLLRSRSRARGERACPGEASFCCHRTRCSHQLGDVFSVCFNRWKLFHEIPNVTGKLVSSFFQIFGRLLLGHRRS